MPGTAPRPYVGRPMKRIEDPKLVTGQGRYVDDLKLPGLAFLAFLRSPHAHARVTAIRTDAARTAPGVIRVVTAADLPPLRPTPFMAVVPGLKASPYRCLAGDIVDSTGVPIAAVVAESPSFARCRSERPATQRPRSHTAAQHGMQPTARVMVSALRLMPGVMPSV